VRIRQVALVMSVIGGGACTTNQQIVPLVIDPPPGPFAVRAPLGRTWDALLETSAQHQWTTGLVARDSGLYTTGPVSFKGWNDLQRNAVGYGCGITGPFYTTLTFRVRGDSAQSTIEITPHLYGINDQDCVTTGRIERSLAREIETRAEGGSVPSR
jgi:hypothetical protein